MDFVSKSPNNLQFERTVQGQALSFIVTVVPCIDSPNVADVLVHILKTGVIQGSMRFTILESRIADKAGELWELLEGSTVVAELDELIALCEPECPVQLLVLEHFARSPSCTLPARMLSRAAKALFTDFEVQMALGWHSTVMVTYPFPVDSYDLEAASKLAKLYEQEWGVTSIKPNGMLRVLALQDLAPAPKQEFGLFDHDHVFRASLPVYRSVMRSWSVLTDRERALLSSRFYAFADLMFLKSTTSRPEPHELIV